MKFFHSSKKMAQAFEKTSEEKGLKTQAHLLKNILVKPTLVCLNPQIKILLISFFYFPLLGFWCLNFRALSLKLS